jgi:hypothetical protein
MRFVDIEGSTEAAGWKCGLPIAAAPYEQEQRDKKR